MIGDEDPNEENETKSNDQGQLVLSGHVFTASLQGKAVGGTAGEMTTERVSVRRDADRGDPEFGGTGSWVRGNLCVRRHDGLADRTGCDTLPLQ